MPACLVGLGVYRQNRRIVVLHISDGLARSICAVSVSVSLFVVDMSTREEGGVERVCGERAGEVARGRLVRCEQSQETVSAAAS